jgi:hypothetical protein
MSQSGKTREEVVKLIQEAQEAKKLKEASKSWADYDPDEPFNPSDYPEFFQKRKQNIPPKIDTNIPRIENPILNNKDELYHILIKHLEENHPEYTKGENLDNILQHTLSYLQELNNNNPLPMPFKKTIQRFISQFKPTPFSSKHIPFDIDFKIPDIHQQPQQVSEELLEKHIKEIIKEYKDMLDILTPKHVIKLLEGILHTDLQNYKTFIKQTIKNNLPKSPIAIQEKPSPKIQQINMEELFGPPSPQEEEINIEPRSPKAKSPKAKSPKAKSPKAKSPKAKSVKRKSVKKSKSVKRKSVKKSKSKRKSVKKSKSKKSKSVKRKSVKKSKSKRKSVKKSKSVKRKSVKRKSVKKSKSVKRKSVKKSKSKKAKSVKRKSVKKSKSVKRKSVKKSKSKRKSVKKSKSKKAKSVKRKSVKKSKSKRKSVKKSKSKKAKSVKKSKSKRKSVKKSKSKKSKSKK